MLLTQYSKYLILMSQYSVPNLISDLQSDKNKGKKARDIRRRHQSYFSVCFFVSWKQKYACICSSICQVGKEITK